MFVETIQAEVQTVNVEEMLTAARNTVHIVRAIQVPGSYPVSWKLLLQVAENGRFLLLPIARTNDEGGIRYEYENLEYVSMSGSRLPANQRLVSSGTREKVRHHFESQFARGR